MPVLEWPRLDTWDAESFWSSRADRQFWGGEPVDAAPQLAPFRHNLTHRREAPSELSQHLYEV
jgi:hypothetical protein